MEWGRDALALRPFLRQTGTASSLREAEGCSGPGTAGMADMAGTAPWSVDPENAKRTAGAVRFLRGPWPSVNPAQAACP